MAEILANISPTPGTLMFLGGAGLLAAALLMSLVTAFTAGRRKRKINERMREIY